MAARFAEPRNCSDALTHPIETKPHMPLICLEINFDGKSSCKMKSYGPDQTLSDVLSDCVEQHHLDHSKVYGSFGTDPA